VRYVIAKLIFLLVALNRKRCDGRSELIVPKCFAAGGGQKISGEGKSNASPMVEFRALV